ncbi:unnamed protein product, partial [Prorocentrum cordatum]
QVKRAGETTWRWFAKDAAIDVYEGDCFAVCLELKQAPRRAARERSNWGPPGGTRRAPRDSCVWGPGPRQESSGLRTEASAASMRPFFRGDKTHRHNESSIPPQKMGKNVGSGGGDEKTQKI